mmetsp:Transcript_10480/g.13640  ORF Transcript_10480/g.13640 Transcript_10480/m.13640 type:complete len:491 (-) Transcript_10480:103-1575(-)
MSQKIGISSMRENEFQKKATHRCNDIDRECKLEYPLPVVVPTSSDLENSANFTQRKNTSKRSNVEEFQHGLFYGFTITPLMVAIAVLVQKLIRQYKGRKSRVLNEYHLSRIRSRDWRNVMKWASSKKSRYQLSLRDLRGNSVLHYAMLYSPPTYVIQAMLDGNPSLPKLKNLDGEFALQWALRGNASLDVIRKVLLSFPRVATMRNCDGLGVYHLVPIGPLKYFVERKLEEDAEINYMTDFANDASTKKCWDTIMILLMMSYHKVITNISTVNSNDIYLPNDVKWRPLHALAASRALIPTELSTLLLKCLKQEVNERDEEGRLPLHIACNNVLDDKIDYTSSGDNDDKPDCTSFHFIITSLISLSPTSIRIRDDNDMLPWDILIENLGDVLDGIQEIIRADAKLKDEKPIDIFHILNSLKFEHKSLDVEKTKEESKQVMIEDEKRKSNEPLLEREISDENITSFASPSMVEALKAAEELFMSEMSIDELS